jgi:hypothetical protein
VQSTGRIATALVLVGCAGGPPPVKPTAQPIADAAIAAVVPTELLAEAAAPPSDAGIAAAPPKTNTVFSTNPFETCPTDEIDAHTVAWLSASILPPEQRAEKLKDGSIRPVRVARAKGKTGDDLVVIVGPHIAGATDDDSDCHQRIDIYRRKSWRALGTAPTARIDGGDTPALHPFFATGDADLSALLVAADERGEPRAIRRVPGAADAGAVEVFKGGVSYRVTFVETGQPMDATVSVHLVALADDGLVDLLNVAGGFRSEYPCDPPTKPARTCSVGPPGGFSVLSRGDRPRLSVLSASSDECASPTTNLNGCTCDASTMTYEPRTRTFVADGASKKKHVAPTRRR